MHGMRQVVNICRSDSCNTNPAILSEVDTVVFRQLCNLIRIHACKAEHSNLVSDMLPVSWRTFFLQSILEFVSHGDYSVGHALDILQPRCSKWCIVENELSNPCSSQRRIRICWTDDDLDLRHDSVCFFFRSTDQSKSSYSFTIQSHVLCKGLSESYLMSILNKLPQCRGISINVSWSKSLISHVKEGEKPLWFDNVGDLLPLLGFWINSSRVVSTGMKKDNRSFRYLREIFQSSLEVKSTGLGFVVSILLDSKTCSGKERNMITPRWVRHPDFFGSFSEFTQVKSSDCKRSCSWNSLDSDIKTILNDGAVVSKGKVCSSLRKLRNTTDRQVFLVHSGLKYPLLCFSDWRKNIGFAIIISVCSNTQRDLLGIRVLFEGFCYSKNGIWRTHLYVRPPRTVKQLIIGLWFWTCYSTYLCLVTDTPFRVIGRHLRTVFGTWLRAMIFPLFGSNTHNFVSSIM